MSIVAAVKEAIEGGLGDYWMLHLPDAQRDAYYSGCKELAREHGDEIRDFIIMRAAESSLKKSGIRGLCYY